jgi:hypothetical protein
VAKRPKKVLQVAFGGTSAGKNTGRIGVKISRDKLDLMLADELFTEQRLEATLTVIPKKDAKGQKNMLPDQFPTISGSFDVKGFSTRSDTFSCGFTYMKKSVDANATTSSQVSRARSRSSTSPTSRRTKSLRLTRKEPPRKPISRMKRRRARKAAQSPSRLAGKSPLHQLTAFGMAVC